MTNPLEQAGPIAGRAESDAEVSMAHKEVFETMESSNKAVLSENNDLQNTKSGSPESMPEQITFDDIWPNFKEVQDPKELDLGASGRSSPYQNCVKTPAGFENNKWINPPSNRYERRAPSCSNPYYQPPNYPYPQQQSPNRHYDTEQNRFTPQESNGNNGLPGAPYPYQPFPGTVPPVDDKPEAPPEVVAPTKPEVIAIPIVEPASAPKLNSLGLSSGW